MLPQHTEPEGNPVCIIPTVKYVSNGKNYSDVIIFPFELIGDRFQMTLKTSDWTRLGKYNVTLALSDTANFTIYWFTLEIFNTAPRFSQSGPVSQIVRLGTVSRYKMPRMQDDENNPIKVAFSNIPSFIKYENDFFIFSPIIYRTDLRIFVIKGDIRDSQPPPSGPLKTDFSFSLQVYNLAPSFRTPLLSQTIFLKTTVVYELPPIEDPESVSDSSIKI